MAAIEPGSAASVPPECTRFGALAETVFRRYARIRKPRTLHVNRSNLGYRILPWFTDRQIADITPHDPARPRTTPTRPDRTPTRQDPTARSAPVRLASGNAVSRRPVHADCIGYSGGVRVPGIRSHALVHGGPKEAHASRAISTLVCATTRSSGVGGVAHDRRRLETRMRGGQ